MLLDILSEDHLAAGVEDRVHNLAVVVDEFVSDQDIVYDVVD